MAGPLLVVDVQGGFLNDFTRHIPGRIARLIQRERPSLVLFTRFVNEANGPYHRFLDWHACESSPETDLAPELIPFLQDELTFTKPGFAGSSDKLKDYLKASSIGRIGVVGIDTDMCVLKVVLDIFDLGIEPLVYTDCAQAPRDCRRTLLGSRCWRATLARTGCSTPDSTMGISRRRCRVKRPHSLLSEHIKGLESLFPRPLV